MEKVTHEVTEKIDLTSLRNRHFLGKHFMMNIS